MTSNWLVITFRLLPSTKTCPSSKVGAKSGGKRSRGSSSKTAGSTPVAVVTNLGPLLDQDEDEKEKGLEKRRVVVKLPRTRVCDVANSLGQGLSAAKWETSRACSDLLKLSLRQHPLDPCVFLSYNGRGEVDVFFALFYDVDLMGAGDTTGKSDSHVGPAVCPTSKPPTSIALGSAKITCSTVVPTPSSVELQFETYTRIKPVTLDTSRETSAR